MPMATSTPMATGWAKPNSTEIGWHWG